MRRTLLVFLAVALAALGLQGNLARAGQKDVQISEFKIDPDVMCDISEEWKAQLYKNNRPGTWAKMKFEPTNDQLARMGLPSKEILTSRRYPRPTLVTKDGRFYEVSAAELARAMKKPAGSGKPSGSGKSSGSSSAFPAVATYGGTGCLGIRPGAWLLLLSDGIGWCSMAHVYGSPGSYDISTAGHCGQTGDTATVVAAFGNRGGAAGPILLDFGKFGTSHDGGLGKDWALIDIYSQYQNLVSPTMCFWGGPRGTYTKTGSLVGVSFGGRSWIPKVSVTPDPLLAQTIVHYGHGIGTGPGGTPRAGEAISWGSSHFMFFGAISFGDSGSGANTLLGDTVGANMEAAGIMTHLYIDPLMRKGLGVMGGTRATAVSGTLANGQYVPYPIPVSGLP